jgi:hypothetical protein
MTAAENTPTLAGKKPVAAKKTRVKRAPSTSTKGHYLTNANLMEQIRISREKGGMTSLLGEYMMLLAERYSHNWNFAGYSFREDMVGFAVVNLCANWHKFDPSKSSNPFAFFTTAVYRSFLQYLSAEKKHREIRDALIVDAGGNPSFAFLDKGKLGEDNGVLEIRTDTYSNSEDASESH